MKNRLEQFLRSQGLTSVKFAEIMQIQPSSVSHILAGRNNPNFDFISRMLNRFPELNPDWLINGTGDVYRSNHNKEVGESTDVNNYNITNVTSSDSQNKVAPEKGHGVVKSLSNRYKSDTNELVTNVTHEPKLEPKSTEIFDTLTEDARVNSRNSLFTVEMQENAERLSSNGSYLNDLAQNDNTRRSEITEQSAVVKEPSKIIGESNITTESERSESNIPSKVVTANTTARKITKIIILYSDATCKVYDSLDE